MLSVNPNITIQMGSDTSFYKNNVVSIGLNWILDLIINQTTDRLTHIAVGDNGQMVSLGDTKLANERVRTGFTSLIREDSTVIADIFFDVGDANFHWREIGLYANGTSAKDSGKLIARAVIDEEKDSMRTALISWDIGITNS